MWRAGWVEQLDAVVLFSTLWHCTLCLLCESDKIVEPFWWQWQLVHCARSVSPTIRLFAHLSLLLPAKCSKNWNFLLINSLLWTANGYQSKCSSAASQSADQCHPAMLSNVGRPYREPRIATLALFPPLKNLHGFIHFKICFVRRSQSSAANQPSSNSVSIHLPAQRSLCFPMNSILN